MWDERKLKAEMARYFENCQREHKKGNMRHQVSRNVRERFISLTCSCGAGCTLEYKLPATAALWALRSLMGTDGGVSGAIQAASLVRLYLNLSPNTTEIN